jgi:prepilin-type N-terminal cleavage/methylation domain-containing protein
MKSGTRGFTIIEVLISIVILSVGVLGMVGTAGLVSRMIGQGKRNTQAATVAMQRMETLREAAMATNPRCTGLAGGTATTNGVAETWTVTGTGQSRRVQLIIRYRTNRGTLTDTVTTVVSCA